MQLVRISGIRNILLTVERKVKNNYFTRKKTERKIKKNKNECFQYILISIDVLNLKANCEKKCTNLESLRLPVLNTSKIFSILTTSALQPSELLCFYTF